MRHPTQREQYDDQQTAIAHTLNTLQTTPMDSPYRTERLQNLRTAYRDLIEIAPARDRRYWIDQRDANLPTV